MNLRTLALLAALAVLGCRERATVPSATPAGSSTPAPVASAPASSPPAATSTTLDTPAYREWARQMGSPAAAAPAPSPAIPAPAAADDHGHSHEADGAARIGAAELESKLKAGEAIVVDVRSREQWEWSRIPGAVHIAYADLFARSVELPHEALIALYCT